MPHVAFVAPHFLENTLRYVSAFASLDDVTLSVISEDPESGLPPVLRRRVPGHYRVRSVGDAGQLAQALRGLQHGVGKVDRLTGALEQLQLPMAEARELAGVPGLKAAIARRFRDKDVMKDVLRAKRVPVAASRLVHSIGELRSFVGEVGFPVIVKPQAGVGSRSTHRLEDEAALESLASSALSPRADQPLQAEQFIRGREFTCETVSIHGTPVWRSGTRYFPGPLEVLETPWIQYCVLLPKEVESPWTEFAPINTAALDALWGDERQVAGTALTHMEWFAAEPKGLYVSEVGARPPGVQIMPLMSLAHEVDFIAKWAELISFDRFTPPTRKWAAGAAFLRGQGHGAHVVSVEGIEAVTERLGPALVELKAPRVGQSRAPGYEGEGIALVRTASTEEAKQALKTVVETVRVRYG